MKNKNIRKRSIGTFVLLLILLCFIFTPALLFSDLNFGPGPTDEKQNPNLSTNYLFKDATYNMTLEDTYDDADPYKVYTDAYFESQYFNSSYEWEQIHNETVDSGVDNNEVELGDPGNINMIKGTSDYDDNMKVLDSTLTDFTSTEGTEEIPAVWRWITGVTMLLGTVSGNILNAKNDDENYFTLTSTQIFDDNIVGTNLVSFNIAPDGSAQDISYYIWSSSPDVILHINDITFKVGNPHLNADDQYHSGVSSVDIIATQVGSSFTLRVYYFRMDSIAVEGTPAELEFDITTPLTNYNKDLLSLHVESHQKVSPATTMNFKIWNYDTSTYDLISGSAETTITKKEFNSANPEDYISPTGQVKLYWIESYTEVDFVFSIDYLLIRICYKMDLWHEISFNMTGLWRSRWEIHGSLQYTDWTNFEVVDPVDPDPNFHAISESDVTTRWILQNATLTAVENFTDDISGANWDLYGVSERTFQKYTPDKNNYLLDNSSITYLWLYTGLSFDLNPEDNFPEAIYYYDGYWWMSGISHDIIFKYNLDWSYTGSSYDVSTEDTFPIDIHYYDGYWWVLGGTNEKVFKYHPNWTYTGTSFPIGSQDNFPVSIFYYNGFWWMAGATNDRIFKYNLDWSYTGTSYYIGSEEGIVEDINFHDGYWWLVGGINDTICKYHPNWTYTGTSYYIGSEEGSVTSIDYYDGYWWLVGWDFADVFQYKNKFSISKNYQGGGYMYMQTNTTEMVSIQSTVYGINYTLSSGDYFEVDFQTSSDSKINLILLRDGVVNKTLTLSPSGNTNFNRQTVQVSVSEDVEFDQLKISSTFEDEDYVRIYDIKTKKYTITGDSADFEVGSNRDHKVYLTPDIYNLKISEEGRWKVNENITIPATGIKQYVYTPIHTQYCRLVLFSEADPLRSLPFTDYHVKVNRSFDGIYNQFWLLDPIFYADDNTYIYIDVYDRFDSLIGSFERLASDYIDLEIEVYSLKIRNEATEIVDYILQNTDTGSSKSGILFSDEIVEYHVKSDNYSLDYINYEDMYPREYNFELTGHRTISINSTYNTIYFGLFTYDGLGLNRDWVRFYINGVRKDFGRNIIQSETANLIVLDYFNNTLANDTIDASAYSEYNIFIEIYSLIILNQFTYEDIVVNITQVGSGIWMAQIIPKQFGFMYRFLPNIEYNITVYFINTTLYSSRIVNLTDNSHIESFGIPTQPSEYPKNVYFGVYTTTGLGINHDLVRFYIDDVRTDFGFNRIEDMIVLLTVKDYFNTTLFNQYINTSGIYEYNILITLFSLKIKNEARETSNYTLKIGGLETTGLIISQEIIEYQLSSNNYVFEYTNNEDDSFHTININLNENKIYIINSTYYTAYFGLFDQYNHRLDNSLFSLYLNGTRKDFGFIELSSEYYNITVYDWLNISVFNHIIYLFNYTEYNIYITVFEFQIRHLAQENSNFSLCETTSGNYINFSMAPDTLTSFILASSTYNVTWTNGENLQTSYYYITLDSNYILTLSSTYRGVYFALFTYDGLGINHDLVKFYINESRKDFGFNMMTSASAEIVVLDFFNTTLFNQTIDFSSLSEYNIFIEIYSLIILNQFTYEDIIVNITQVDSGIWLNHIIPKQFALSYRLAPNINYTINVYYVNESLYTTRTINLTENNHIESFGTPTLPSEYPKDVYFSVYTGTGLAIDQLLLKFYIDGDRADFGFNIIENMNITITVKDFFNTTLFNQVINTSGIYEYDILITIYSLKIKNEAELTANYTLRLGGLTETGNILPHEIIEYQLSSNNYIFEYTNNEDDSFHTININLNQDRVYILNTTYYNIFFSLNDLNLHIFHPYLYEFRLNGTIQVLGLVEDLQTDNYNITVKDRFGTYLFNNIVNLRGLNEYRIDITLYELQIRHLARENSNLTLTEDILGNNYSFIMTPDSIKSIVIGSSNYTLNWINGEDSQLTTFSIILTEDTVIKLDTIHFSIYFSLYDQNNHRLDDSLFSLYLNSSRKDFGFIELSSEYYNITVYDWLNVSVFDQIVYLANYNEYNIFITVFELQIRHLAQENSNFSLCETTSGNYINFSMAPDTIRSFMLANSTYNVTWINGENMLSSFYNITLNINHILTLDTTYYEVYIGLYNFYGIVNKEEVKFYINRTRADFGFNIIKSKYVNLLVLDYFNSTLYNQIVKLEGLTEYSIFIQAYILVVNNLYNNQSITIKITRGGITVERLIEAQGWTEFKLYPNIKYEIISYVNGTIDEEKEVDLDEEYKTVSFGFFETDVPYDPEPLIFDTTILVGFIIVICVFVCIIVILYANWKIKAKEVPEETRLKHKRNRTTAPAGTYDHR